MNTTILQKCVDELKNEKPDIRYILGMLETFIELSSGAVLVAKTNAPMVIQPTTSTQTFIPADEEDTEIARKYVGGPIGNIT